MLSRGFPLRISAVWFSGFRGFRLRADLERAQAWKACGQSFPALFPGLASGAGIVGLLKNLSFRGS